MSLCPPLNGNKVTAVSKDPKKDDEDNRGGDPGPEFVWLSLSTRSMRVPFSTCILDISVLYLTTMRNGILIRIPFLPITEVHLRR
jgi:hypothetical protein